jgi:hypothetical protein
LRDDVGEILDDMRWVSSSMMDEVADLAADGLDFVIPRKSSAVRGNLRADHKHEEREFLHLRGVS